MEPPGDVVERGLSAVISYWQDAEIYGRTMSNKLKVVLVGLGYAGKTSIALRLEGRGGHQLPALEERTIGVEIRDVQLGPSPADRSRQNLAVKLWDFAGQREYYDTHQIFLTHNALYVLVVDMFAYRDENGPEEAVEQWLDILQSRVPGAVILLVGTRRDALDKFGLYHKRMEEFNEDVWKIKSRLNSKCAASEQRAPGSHNTGSHNSQPLRIVEEMLVLDCKSSGKGEIDKLCALIERVAYSSDYSFPSVQGKLPKPYVYAFLTLEAVRRGADLDGVGRDIAMVHEKLEGGDSDTAKAFVGFHPAFVLFADLWKALEPERAFGGARRALGRLWGALDPRVAHGNILQERSREDVFLSAIELNETQGAILLTSVDGGAEERQGNRPDRSQLVIHVDPVWFADQVRRIADVRLVARDNQEKVRDELIRFARDTRTPLDELSGQQVRFYAGGEVSKLYLRFLWLHRDLDLGQATKESPPLKMTDADVDAMVSSLLDLRIIFPVRDGAGGFVPDRYVVGSCLPNHVKYDVTPETMLKLDVGSALFRQALDVCGARNMPPGLMPRLLAWCGRGEGRITACWRRGGCFTFEGYLVLVYEQRGSDENSSIVCCVKGDANTEKAGKILDEVVKEVSRLVRDPRYGFPGIELWVNGQEEPELVASQKQLEPLLRKLEEALEDHMNVNPDELEKKSDRMAGGVNEVLHQGFSALNVEIGRIAGAVHAVDERLKNTDSKIDSMAAVAGKCLLLSAKEHCPCPRLIWIEEDTASSVPSPAVGRFGHFRRKAWDKISRKKGQTSPSNFRVRFLCAHNLSAADCGQDGKGYVVKITDWQRWLQKCLPLLQISLWLLRVAVSVVARADLLPVDDVLGKLREVAGEEVAARIEALDLTSMEAGNGDLATNIGKQVEVFGKAYEELAKLVEEEELAMTRRAVGGAAGGTPSVGAAPIAGRSTAVGGPGYPVAQTTRSITVPAGTRSFETDMVLAYRTGGGSGGVEWAWVRRDNESAWKVSVATKVVGLAPP